VERVIFYNLTTRRVLIPYNIVVLVKQIYDLELVKINSSTGEPVLEGVPFRFETLSKNAV